MSEGSGKDQCTNERSIINYKDEIRTPQNVRRPNGIRERVEHERRDDRARLATRGAHTVRERTHPRWEDFSGVALRRTVVLAPSCMMRRREKERKEGLT